VSKATLLDRAALNRHPLPEVDDGDKDEHGRILIVAGSRDVPGGAILSPTAAMRAGAGKLKIVTVASAAAGLGLAMPEAMVIGLAEDRAGGFARGADRRIAELASEVDAVVAGPGLAENAQCAKIANVLLESDVPVALDAALLRAIEPLTDPERSSLPLLLPHSGELASMLDCKPEEIEADPVRSGVRAAQLYQSIVLVKGVVSHVVTPDEAVWTYRGGAPGLGVSGSGDTLAGIAGGLLARGADPLAAMLWAVWLHGEAGAALARKIGSVGFLAREIPGEVPGLLSR
jgi:ADP-dependent NAD(P)H-hydrate dehydratase